MREKGQAAAYVDGADYMEAVADAILKVNKEPVRVLCPGEEEGADASLKVNNHRVITPRGAKPSHLLLSWLPALHNSHVRIRVSRFV